MNEDVKKSTEIMFQYNEVAVERLASIQQEENYEVKFFEEVKPYGDIFFKELDEWASLVTKWLKKERPKYIHVNQVETLKENLQNVVLQSFYPETREKRFKKMYHSNKYVLESILNN
ncbi:MULTISPECIES: YppE family protein [Priestia]|uniref:YppE family protein n=1 Tax=Priestia TaxID=2800373 RepID=UPI0021F4A864|nr:YppE family protein [Priestia megaterium]UYP06421.1 YppE family protein [Priestia megaterium]